MIRPGEIYLADFEEMGPHSIVVISREELNRGHWIAALLITSSRFAERAKQPNCVPFQPGEFGLSRACVAQAGSIFSLRREDLGECLGRFDAERWREVVRAIGNMMGSECEPG